MSPVLSWQNLRDWLAYEVPAEHRDAFARAIAFANWQRAAVFSVVVAVTNVFFGILPAVVIFARSTGELRSIYAVQTGWHVGVALFAAAIWVCGRRDRPEREVDALPRHQRLALAFCAVMLSAMALFSVLKHRTSGDVSMYLIGVAAVGGLFYLPPRFCAWLYTLTFSGFVAGMLFANAEPVITWIHTGEALVAISIFWVGSRLMYALKAMNLVQLITIRRQAEELAAANEELARANQFKADLLEHLAHDLRDPLNTISLSAQSMRQELPADSPARDLAGSITERTWHMAEFIRNLLTDAVSATQRISLERRNVSMCDFVAQVVDGHRPFAAAKSIDLHVVTDQTAERAPAALIDPIRFRQVIENLITNAVKYSPTGRNVWIHVRYAASEGHRIEVRDEGPGLTEEDQRRLFARYQRLSARPTGGEMSTGLGLAIVKQIVQLHGGRVWAESPGRNRGASFIVCVPS